MNEKELVEALLTASDTQARLFLLKGNSASLHIDIVYALKEQADKFERDDARRALEIGQIAQEVAEFINSDEARALAFWIQANAQDLLADLESASHSYEQAAHCFEKADKPLEASRTSIGHVETLAKLGKMDQAQALAEASRKIFVEFNDLTSQAKIDMNLGNLYYRRGDYSSALESYRNATWAFQTLGNDLYAAMNQINQANMLTVLDDFLGAEKLHKLARPILEDAGLRTVVASVDANLAVFQAYRGNYAKAFQTFEQARSIFSSLSMQVNMALTDLDESDLYLDINLPKQALQLATQAEAALDVRHMPFEVARAKVNQGIALARSGEMKNALLILDSVRETFASQGNETWVANTDLQRAEIMGRMGEHDLARRLATRAAQIYQTLGMKTKQSHAHLICANLWTDDTKWTQALDELKVAGDALTDIAAPWLEARIETCKGRVYEGMGKVDLAIEYYQQAAKFTEKMMATIAAEDHRTAYIADKLYPYEALVSLYAKENPSLAFQWAEQAKSRALVDLLAAGVRPRLHIKDEMDANNAQRLQLLREELNWLYTRLIRGEAPGDPSAPAASAETWAKIQEREKEASLLWRRLQARYAEELSLLRETPLSASDVQANLSENSAIVEYFISRGQLIIFVLTKQNVFAQVSTESIEEIMKLMGELDFQFSKFEYGSTYYERHKNSLIQTVNNLLDRLGDKLISPVLEKLSDVEMLNIIPHGPLHALPFHGLRSKGKFLMESFAVSYAPSAAILNYCWNKSDLSELESFDGRALLVGVPDERATHVSQEVQKLATLIQDHDVLLGEEATLEKVESISANYELFHLAAHGLFRPETPLLSSIRLADQWMAVQDIYDLELKASLVTLSACETGLGHDMGGDEMVGLVRGFFHAGAKSLLVSLWMVDDKSMTELMSRFYSYYINGSSKSHALRQAQIDLMKQYDHPYYWAPMILVGNEN